MKIDQQFLTPNKYSRPQIKLTKVTKVAIHYVGNPGSSAQANHDYFENLKRQTSSNGTYVSSHYLVGLKGEIIQNIPETEWSYCTNQANGYSISIETCHPKSDGKFNAVTEESLAELTADICTRYGLDPQKDVIRHYDVTGKKCPLYYVNHPDAWANFKNMVEQKMKKTYSKSDGKWKKEGTKWRWVYPDGTYLKSDWLQISSDKKWYYIDDDGYCITGYRKINGVDYYFATQYFNSIKECECMIPYKD